MESHKQGYHWIKFGNQTFICTTQLEGKSRSKSEARLWIDHDCVEELPCFAAQKTMEFIISLQPMLLLLEMWSMSLKSP